MKVKNVNILKALLKETNLKEIRKSLRLLKEDVYSNNTEMVSVEINGNEKIISKNYFMGEIEQILKTKTLQRTHYYINRLVKGFTEDKTSGINDLNLNRWKEYADLITDSLWVIDKRDKSGAHSAGYWGNFIPQIPNQFLRRYTKKGEWILDPFLGSGTTLIECKRLGRNGFGIELNDEVIKLAKANLIKEKIKSKVKVKVIKGDSGKVDLKSELKKMKTDSVQFVLLHPPYWDIINFSKKKSDLSNAKSVEEFLKMFGKVIDNTCSVLDKGRYLAVVIGDKYTDGEWIPLGFYTMQEVMKRGYKLKSTIVKNFDTTKGKLNQKELWRYRALAGGFYIFKHEYIFLFKKEKGKRNV